MNVPLTARQLRAFLALAKARHFTRAAQSIPLSQSAFSATIRSLEQAVGAPLFQRDTRNVTLTAEGLAFEGPARRALQELEDGLEGVRGLLQHRRGRASVALLPSLAAGWFPPVLATFTRAYPGVEIRVSDVLSERGIELVRSGQADFGITTQTAEDHGLASTFFTSDRFELVCRHDHRLANASRVVAKDLAGECFVTQVRHSIVGRYLEGALPPRDAPRLVEVEQLPTVIGLVRAGIGLAAIPQLNLYDFHYPDLVRRELMLRGLERRMFVVQQGGRPLSAAAQALLDWLVAHRPTGTTRRSEAAKAAAGGRRSVAR